MGFHCMGCLIERVVWRLKHLKTEEGFAGISRLSIPWSISCALHVLECEESGQMETAMSREYLIGKAFSRDTCEAFCSASLSSLIHAFCAYIIYTHITHKCEESFWEKNPSKNTRELEIFIPTILYTFVCGISSSPTSPFPNHWEFVSPNTHHIIWECQVKIWSYWEALEEKPRIGGCNRVDCGIRRARQDRVPRSLVGVGAWRLRYRG